MGYIGIRSTGSIYDTREIRREYSDRRRHEIEAAEIESGLAEVDGYEAEARFGGRRKGRRALTEREKMRRVADRHRMWLQRGFGWMRSDKPGVRCECAACTAHRAAEPGHEVVMQRHREADERYLRWVRQHGEP